MVKYEFFDNRDIDKIDLDRHTDDFVIRAVKYSWCIYCFVLFVGCFLIGILNIR